MVPEDVSHLCVCRTCHIWSLRSWNQHHHWIHIEKWFPKMYHTCVCQTCHMRSLWSWNWHHHWIHIKKRSPKMMRTPWGLHKTLKGLPWLLSRLCKVHEESMRSPWECVGDCKIQNLSHPNWRNSPSSHFHDAQTDYIQWYSKNY